MARPNIPIVVIGAGGHARVVIETIRRQGIYDPVACLSRDGADGQILGVPVVGKDEDLNRLRTNGVEAAFIALGSNKLREKLAIEADGLGFDLPTIIDPSAIISQTCTIAQGVLIMPSVVINAEAEIERFSILNTACVVEHNCRIGVSAHVAPGAVLAGRVYVGDRTFLGARSVVRPNVQIGSDVIIGAGAAVVCDIPADQVWVGVPAKQIKSN